MLPLAPPLARALSFCRLLRKHSPETDFRAYISCAYPRSAEKKQELALPAGVVAGMGAMMAHPLVAEAGVTPRSEICIL